MRDGAAARYQPDVTPIVAVAADSREAAAQLASLIAPGEHLHGVGVAPALDPRLRVVDEAPLPQMICNETIASRSNAPVTLLTDAHRADMLELTALVFPAYFRRRTSSLGRYIGIYDGPRLAAMAGERMHAGRWREVSAVCTHPDYSGRGYAQQLMAELCNAILGRGETPFLHVSPDNERALKLYRHLGFVERRRMPFWAVERVDDADRAAG
jgi:ribosomal protein S18 acetylase RimI-like enzyme